MSQTDELLANNARYAESAGTARLSRHPARKLCVVTCMDSRIDVFAMLGLANGEAHVVRNGGGIVTDDVLRSVLLSQHLMGTVEVILVHHTDCGMLTFDDDELADEIEQQRGVRPPFALGAFPDLDESVRRGLERVRTSGLLPQPDHARGFVYDVDTGRLREVADR